MLDVIPEIAHGSNPFLLELNPLAG
jgi:hypothetical protein